MNPSGQSGGPGQPPGTVYEDIWVQNVDSIEPPNGVEVMLNDSNSPPPVGIEDENTTFTVAAFC